jgi:hypothetical protein
MKRLNFVLALLPLVLVAGCVTRTVREKRTELCADLQEALSRRSSFPIPHLLASVPCYI